MFASVVLFVLLAGGSCAAADAFAPPLIGYVFDETGKQVRAITGTPGAGRVTAPVPLEIGIHRAVLAPGRAYGVASVSGGEVVAVLRALDTAPAIQFLDAGMKSFDLAAFSPAGKAVALYGTECACVQVVTGLPETPVLSRTIEATDGMLALAVNDDASLVALSSPSELVLHSADSAQVWTLTASSLAFSADARALAVLDPERKAVFLIRDPGGAAEWTTVASGGALDEPVALAFLNASTLLIADASAGAHVLDMLTGQTATAECACRPAVAERTALDHTFRLSGVGHGAVWLLHVSDDGIRTVFVPVQRGGAPEFEE